MSVKNGSNARYQKDLEVKVARRHALNHGSWDSVATRLDEVISAHSGEDPFEESLKLIVAKLIDEVEPIINNPFPRFNQQFSYASSVNRLLGRASQKWPGIIDPGDSLKLNEPELKRCAEILGPLRLIEDDFVGIDAIFEFIVNKAAKGQKGQYFTPRFVIDEIVKMLEPADGELVVDPACGSGGFLWHSLARNKNCIPFGFDQDLRAIKVARVMLAASGREPSSVMRLDSLRRPDKALFPEPMPVIEDVVAAQIDGFQGFDLVLTNPPFAGDVGNEFNDSYVLAKNKRVERDVLFIERCIELLRPGGRFAIVLPYNKLGGGSWAYVRRWLLEHARILAVLGLGRNTFQPHTSQKTCVLIGTKRQIKAAYSRDEEVLFYISERDGKDQRGNLIKTLEGNVDHDLQDAVSIVRESFSRIEQRGPTNGYFLQKDCCGVGR